MVVTWIVVMVHSAVPVDAHHGHVVLPTVLVTRSIHLLARLETFTTISVMAATTMTVLAVSTKHNIAKVMQKAVILLPVQTPKLPCYFPFSI